MLNSLSLCSRDLLRDLNYRDESPCISFYKKSESNFNQLDIVSNDYLCYEINDVKLKIIRYELTNEGRKASVYTIINIDNWFDNCDYEMVNSLIEVMLLDINSLTKWSIVSLLRSTYSAKELLPHWQEFYEKSYIHLEESNYDPRKLLRGLNR